MLLIHYCLMLFSVILQITQFGGGMKYLVIELYNIMWWIDHVVA